MYKPTFTLLVSITVVATALSGCGIGDAIKKEEQKKGPFAVLFVIDGEMPSFSGAQDILGSKSMSQYRLMRLMEKASNDINVQEVVVHLGSLAVSLARAQEIAGSLKRVTSKKKLTCHIDSADNVGYFIAAAGCPRIILSPAGGVEALGLSMESVYLKDLLASVGVFADVIHIGEYKDAAEPLTQNAMSEQAREAAEGMLFEMHRILVDGISSGRKLDGPRVQELLDSGPHHAAEAVALGLADEVMTLQAHLDILSAKYPGGVDDMYGAEPPTALSFTDLIAMLGEKAPSLEPEGPKVAIVPIEGQIMSGKSNDMLGGISVVRDMDVTETLSELARDDAVKAVVLRIESPGGSPLASDNIWNAVKALAAKKPVVASMGDVAASGGYYVAAAAREIFAEPATLTGSIGVVGGKLVLNDAAEKLGIHAERIQTGKRAGLNSPFAVFSDEERVAVTAMMTRYYDLFVDRVAEGRSLPREKVLESAKGRVWTGSQARKIGLVNRSGGLIEALARARELASLPTSAPTVIRPRPKSFMDILKETLSEPSARVIKGLIGRRPSLAHGLGAAFQLIHEPVLAIPPAFFSIR